MIKMNRQKRLNQRGSQLAEYVVLIGLTLAAIILVNVQVQKAVKSVAAKFSDDYIGTQAPENFSAYAATGGRQLADQTGFYDISGDTTTVVSQDIQQHKSGDGMRSLTLNQTEKKTSPGDSGVTSPYLFSPSQEYRLEDTEKEPEYVPPFVSKEEGFVQVPQRGS